MSTTADRRNYDSGRSTEQKPGSMILKLRIRDLPPPPDRTSKLPPVIASRQATSTRSEIEQLRIDEVIKDLSQLNIHRRVESSKEPPSWAAGRSEKLLPNHACFELSRQFAKKWKISDLALDSHIKLACGYLRFPVILLLNPAPNHESLSFDQMVAECKTLTWIKNVLNKIGLDMDEIIILDACTLLSTDRINELYKQGKEIKEQVLSESYDVTQKMLEMIKPSTIVSCQCSTSFTQWGNNWHVVSRELCSSIRRAKKREVKKVMLGSHTVNVVQAYHPSGFLNYTHNRRSRLHPDPSGEQLEDLLAGIYDPCALFQEE